MATHVSAPLSAEPQHKPVAARITKHPTEGHTIYQHGDVTFPIDTEDLAKALQQADDIGEGQAKRLMALNGMETDPWVWRLARPVMLSYVQLVWWQHRGAKPEETVRLVEKLKTREAHYQQEVARVKAKPPKPARALSDAIRGGGKRVTPQHVAGQLFQLRPDREEIWGKFQTGQKKTLIDKMKSLGRPVSSSELAQLLTADGFKATQPVERVTAFYYGEWKRNGLIEQVASAEAPPAEAPSATQSKPEPTKREPAKGGGKKK